MDAVVTAGGRIAGALAEQTGQTIKCLIEFDGQRLIDRVLEALHESECVERVAVVGPPGIRDTLPLADTDVWLDEAESGPANMLRGLRAFADSERVVLATSDLPFVSAAAIDGLVDRAPADPGLCYPIFTREEVRARFPHEANSYLPLLDGDMTGSSVVLIRPACVLDREAEIRALFDLRKDFLKLAGLLGWDMMVKLALTKLLKRRLLSVEVLVERFRRLAGFPVAVVRGCSPELSLDIDHERDWAEALAHLDQRDEGTERC